MERRKLVDFFAKKGPLSNGLRTMLENGDVLRRQVLKKGQFLITPQFDPGEMHFLVSGRCKAYWVTEKFEEQIFYFWIADSMVLQAEYFFAGQPGDQCYIEMQEDSVVLSITKTQFDAINAAYPEMRLLMEMVRAEIMALRNQQVRILMRKEGERYRLFCMALSPAHREKLTDREVYGFIGVGKSTLTLSKSMLGEDDTINGNRKY